MSKKRLLLFQEAEQILERIDQLHLEFAKRAAVSNIKYCCYHYYMGSFPRHVISISFYIYFPAI